MIFHDPRDGCVINSVPCGLCVLGETFSFVHGDAPLMTVRARRPHLTLNFISSYTLEGIRSNKNTPEGEEKIPPTQLFNHQLRNTIEKAVRNVSVSSV